MKTDADWTRKSIWMNASTILYCLLHDLPFSTWSSIYPSMRAKTNPEYLGIEEHLEIHIFCYYFIIIISRSYSASRILVEYKNN